MSKVLLINTLSSLDYWETKQTIAMGYPMGLLTIGTELQKEGHEVVIVDPMIDKNYFDIIKDSIAGSLWVGISTMTNGVGSAIQISKFVKELNPDIPICWGGVHPTLFSSQVVENEYCDYVCWGEGERFATEFTKCLESEGVLDNIQGLGYVDSDGKTKFNPRNYFVDINDLGMPNYDLLDMEKYLYRDFSTYSVKANPQKGKFIVITTGIGCPYRCTFCWDNHPSQKFRIKSLENLMENIDYVVKRWDPDVIHLQDDLFFSKKERFFGFLDEYDKRGYRFQWYSNCRANYIADSYLNDEVLDRTKDKVIWLGVGIESGSEKVREELTKQLSTKAILRAGELLGKYEIVTGWAFMTGLPFEKTKDTVDTIELMKKLKKLNPFGRFAFQVFRPYPGSPLYELAVKSGFVPPKELEGWEILEDSSNSGGIRKDIIPWIDMNEANFFSNVVLSVDKRFLQSKGSWLRYAYYRTQAIFYRSSYEFRRFFNIWGFYYEPRLESVFRTLAQQIYRKIFGRKSKSMTLTKKQASE